MTKPSWLFPLVLISVLTTAPVFADSTFVLLYQKNGAATFDYLGTSVAGAGDVNGDGRTDFIIGDYFAEPGGLNSAGSAYVYSGATGTLLFQKNGAAAGDALGYSVAVAGDVNGDGRADFIIGAPGADPGGLSSAGSAFVYSGADGSLLFQKNGATISGELGYSVAGAGDVNGDGRADFIISVPLANPGGLGGAGSAFVYSGVDGSLLLQKDGAAVGDWFGRSVAGAGDVNGDGKADFIVGAPLASPGGVTVAGSAYVYSGATGSLLFQKDGVAGDVLGFSVAGAGDVDGDGKEDFIIGAYQSDAGELGNAGSAFVYSGATGVLLYQKDGSAAGDHLGYSVAGAGDVNGDGKADFIIGAPDGCVCPGSAYAYSGATGTLLFEKNGGGDHGLGFSVTGAGDVNGDGRADFIIGAPGADPGGLTDAGSAYVYGLSCGEQSYVPGLRLSGVEKSSDGLVYRAFLPAQLDSVQVNNYLKFRGRAVSISGQPLENYPILVYNSNNYNPPTGTSGIDTIFTNVCGEFTYPNPTQYPQGFRFTKEGFWPMWFAANDSQAVPFLLTVGNGCSSCSIDSIVAALNADTSGLFDAVAVINDTTDPLVFPIYSYPANDSNLSDSANDRFWAVYSLKYFGPLVGYLFLFNPPVPVFMNSNGRTSNNSIDAGWLLRGDEIVAARLDGVAKDMPSYFKTIEERLLLVAEKDTSTGLWRPSGIFHDQNIAFDLKKFAWPVINTAKTVGRFAADNWDHIVCGGACFVGGFGFGDFTACVPFAVGVIKKVVKEKVKEGLSTGCDATNNPTICRAQNSAVVDLAFFTAKMESPRIPTGISGAICTGAQLIKDGIDLMSEAPALTYSYDQAGCYWNQGPSFGGNDYKSYKCLNLKKAKTLSAIERAEMQINDTIFFDIYVTTIISPSFSLRTFWDNPSNPQNLNLQIVSDKILFAAHDTVETLAGLALTNAGDTVPVSGVAKIDDSTYSVLIPVSILPNYVPGQQYSATLIANGQDLFSNYGEEHQSVALAIITIDGGEIATQENWKLSIPAGSLPSNTLVTMIPASPNFGGGSFASSSVAISNPHFLGDVVAVTPTDLVLNSPASLTLPFDTTGYKELVDSTVVIARFDSIQGWRSLGGTVNVDSGLVTASIPQFGIFGVVAFPRLGDLDRDQSLTSSDVVLELNCVFLGQGDCNLTVADVDCDAELTSTDVVLLLNAVFLGLPFPCQ